MVSSNAAAASYSRCGRGGGHRGRLDGRAAAHSGAIGTRQSPRLPHNASLVHLSGATTVFWVLGRGVGSRIPGDYSPPPPARSLNFGKTPASMGNSVSSLSQSRSTTS